jgi:16S rRNA (cytosine967-C5)-methyltransferase
MSRYHSYINSAKGIIQSYKNEMPLHLYLKNFFSGDKKFGSRDRKTIASLCYFYYRLGHGENLMTVEERLLAATFLCSAQRNKLLEDLRPEWNEKIYLPLQEKLKYFPDFYSPNIFKWANELSEGIEGGTYSLSFLIQPKLFLRIRPGMERKVLKKLEINEIEYQPISDTCIALDNGAKISDVFEINNEVVVQDYNSQRVGEFIALAFDNNECAECKVWDCCAASGGKSMMAHDIMPKVELTVSDVRASILHNLQQRFAQAGIKTYQSFIADLRNYQKVGSEIGEKKYNLIICDAPCSGSGTWSRTPEQLYFFKQEEIDRYVSLQKDIVTNVVPHLAQGGQLLYITCSVFKKENEEMAQFITEKLHLKLTTMQLLKGYPMQADTMFAALFHKHAASTQNIITPL